MSRNGTALELQVRGATDVCGRDGEPAACGHPARNPLGEKPRGVMKTPLQRDYIGIQEKRVVQEIVKESYQDRLRLIPLVPAPLARKATIVANEGMRRSARCSMRATRRRL